MSAINELVETFINGNLSDARKRSNNFGHRALRQAYQDMTGCSDRTAAAFADWCKGDVSFQKFCDTKHVTGEV